MLAAAEATYREALAQGLGDQHKGPVRGGDSTGPRSPDVGMPGCDSFLMFSSFFSFMERRMDICGVLVQEGYEGTSVLRIYAKGAMVKVMEQKMGVKCSAKSSSE